LFPERIPIMRVNGRVLRYGTLAERRLFLSLGITELRVPRSMNPYTVARRIARAAKNNTPDMEFFKALATQAKRPPDQPPVPPPDFDRPEPVLPEHELVHAEAA
jgi:hypothetical protein